MRSKEFTNEKWSKKYKRSINCDSPKGFSQRAHCQGRAKNEDGPGPDPALQPEDPNVQTTFTDVAKGWDQWSKENPVARSVIGRIPVVGQIAAAGDVASAAIQGNLEKAARGAAGFIPGGVGRDIQTAFAVKDTATNLEKGDMAGAAKSALGGAAAQGIQPAGTALRAANLVGKADRAVTTLTNLNNQNTSGNATSNDSASQNKLDTVEPTSENSKKKKKRIPKRALYGPGPYGWYGTDVNYSSDAGDIGESQVSASKIHTLADKKNIKWDNEPSFLKLCKKLTGVAHLDDMNETELRKIYNHLKSLSSKKIKENKDAVIKNLSQDPKYRDKLVYGYETGIGASKEKKMFDNPISFVDLVRQGLAEDIDYQRHLQLINAHMKKIGYGRLGGGRDAQVYAKQEGNIIKILIPQDEKTVRSAEIPFLEFYKYCQANQKNPHLPKFGKIQGQDYTDFYLDGERFVQIAQERLVDIPAPSEYDDMLFDMIDSVENNTPLEQQYPGYELFYKTLKSVAQRGRALGFENDFIKSDDDFNIMLRAKTLVITDPWLATSFNEDVAENFADRNSNDLFLNNLYKMLKQKYPKSEFNLKSDSVESTDGQLTVIAGVEEDDDYIGCFMWDVQTGPYKGVLQPAIKQTTEQLLQSNPGKEPALFIGGDNENPQAWKRIAKNLGYEYISDDELDENFADGRNPQDKGDAKRHGINTKASVSSLRKTAKQGGRKGQLAHWLANMKAGRAKAKRK